MSSRPHTIHAAFDDEAAKHWSEGTSRLFIDNGRYFVPERDHQMRIVAALLSYLEGSCVILELCCGEGLLAEVLLDSFSIGGYVARMARLCIPKANTAGGCGVGSCLPELFMFTARVKGGIQMSFLKKFFGPPDIEKLKANRDHLKLLDVLRNQMDPTLRQKAAEALVDIGCGREAVEVLRAMGNALAIDPLFVIIAKEKNSRVRLSAQQALRKINHPRVSRYFLPSFGSVESNVRHLNDPDKEKRFIAARALGMQGDKRALP